MISWRVLPSKPRQLGVLKVAQVRLNLGWEEKADPLQLALTPVVENPLRHTQGCIFPVTL